MFTNTTYSGIQSVDSSCSSPYLCLYSLFTKTDVLELNKINAKSCKNLKNQSTKVVIMKNKMTKKEVFQNFQRMTCSRTEWKALKSLLNPKPNLLCPKPNLLSPKLSTWWGCCQSPRLNLKRIIRIHTFLSRHPTLCLLRRESICVVQVEEHSPSRLTSLNPSL